MNIFIDNNLSPALARSLNGFLEERDEGKAVHLRDKFDPATKDETWIKALKKENCDWIVISADLKITKNKAEKEAWREAKLKGFFVNKAFLKREQHLIVSRVFALLEIIKKASNKSSTKNYLMYRLPVKGNTLEDLDT